MSDFFWRHIFIPHSRASHTVYWFLYGRRFHPSAIHPNCRCVIEVS